MGILRIRRSDLMLGLVAAAAAAVPVATEAQRPDVAVPAASDATTSELERPLFAPLMADERQVRTFFKLASGGSPFEDTRVFSVGVGDAWRLARLGAGPQGGVVQLMLAGAVFSQFDFDVSTFDFLQADFVVGFPIVFRKGRFSGRLRPYHQSSHLGDDFLSRVPQEERRTFDYESLELMASVDAAGLRLYAGGEHRFRRTPGRLEPLVVHAGAEGRQPGVLGHVPGFGSARLMGAIHLTAAEVSGWAAAWSLRAGVEVSPHEADTSRRRVALLLELFDGPSPYGQFYADAVYFVGIGFHITH